MSSAEVTVRWLLSLQRFATQNSLVWKVRWPGRPRGAFMASYIICSESQAAYVPWMALTFLWSFKFHALVWLEIMYT